MIQNITIQWQAGTPNETGKYLITTKQHKVEVDIWLSTPDIYGEHWERYFDDDVIAWCLIENIEPFKF